VKNTEGSHGTRAALKTDNCTFHHEKRNEKQQLGAEFICAHENNYSKVAAIKCNVQC